MTKVPESLMYLVTDRPVDGDRVSVTLGDITAYGTMVGGAANGGNDYVVLDGTEQGVWVPLGLAKKI